MTKDIFGPLRVTKVKVVWNEQTARILHEKLGIPFDQLPDECKRFLKDEPRPATKQTRRKG